MSKQCSYGHENRMEVWSIIFVLETLWHLVGHVGQLKWAMNTRLPYFQFFCHKFRLQSITIHCNGRRFWTKHLTRDFFLVCTFSSCAQALHGSRCHRRVFTKPSLPSACHPMSHDGCSLMSLERSLSFSRFWSTSLLTPSSFLPTPTTSTPLDECTSTITRNEDCGHMAAITSLRNACVAFSRFSLTFTEVNMDWIGTDLVRGKMWSSETITFWPSWKSIENRTESGGIVPTKSGVMKGPAEVKHESTVWRRLAGSAEVAGGSAELGGDVDQGCRSCWRGWPWAPKLLAKLTGSAEVAGEVDQESRSCWRRLARTAEVAGGGWPQAPKLLAKIDRERRSYSRRLTGSAEVTGEERGYCWRRLTGSAEIAGEGWPGAPKLLSKLTRSTEVAGEGWPGDLDIKTFLVQNKVVSKLIF